jgi:hypothetical protein
MATVDGVSTAAADTVVRSGCDLRARKPVTGMMTIAAHNTAPTRRLCATT